MADKKKRTIKKAETVREKAAKSNGDQDKKPRRIKKVTSQVSNKTSSIRKKGQQAYYLPLPETGILGSLNKHRSIVPGFLRNAWNELKGVTWPDRSETFRLTVAVLLFALFFGSLIAGIDYILDNLFRRVILGL